MPDFILTGHGFVRSHGIPILTNQYYRPNLVAQSLRTQRSGLVGLISDEIATTPYAGRIIEGAQDAAWEHNKILVLVNTKKNPDIEKVAINSGERSRRSSSSLAIMRKGLN
jgi:DNA-binding LacI/PurR family transcriptional regulator